MKFLTALMLTLPLSSFAANYATCDLYKFSYDSTDTLIESQRVSNTWQKLAGKGDVVLEDRVEGASYSVNFSLTKGFIFGSLQLDDDFAIITQSEFNEILRISIKDRENNKGDSIVYTLSCELES